MQPFLVAAARTPRLAILPFVLIGVSSALAQPSAPTQTTAARGSIFVAPSDPRLIRFLADDGVTYEILGLKNPDGRAEKITGIRTIPKEGPATTAHLDDLGRPTLVDIENTGYARYEWVSETTAHIQVYDISGSLLAHDFYDFVRGDTNPGFASNGHPRPDATFTPYALRSTTVSTASPGDVQTNTVDIGAASRVVTVRIADCTPQSARKDALQVTVLLTTPHGVIPIEAHETEPGTYIAPLQRVKTAHSVSADALCPNLREAIETACLKATTAVSWPVAIAAGTISATSSLGKVLTGLGGFGAGIHAALTGVKSVLSIPCLLAKPILVAGDPYLTAACEFTVDESDPLKDLVTFPITAVALLRDCDSAEPHHSQTITVDLRDTDPITLDIDGCDRTTSPRWSAMVTTPDGKVLMGDHHASTFMDAMTLLGNQDALKGDPVYVTTGKSPWNVDEIERAVLLESDPVKLLRTVFAGSWQAWVHGGGGALTISSSAKATVETKRRATPEESDQVDAHLRAWNAEGHSKSATFLAFHEITLQPGQAYRIDLEMISAVTTGPNSQFTARLAGLSGLNTFSVSPQLGTPASIRISYEQVAESVAILQRAGITPELITARIGAAQVASLRKELEQQLRSVLPEPAVFLPTETRGEVSADAPHCLSLRLMITIRAEVGLTGSQPGQVFGHLKWTITPE